jgi:hypothetical protein
MEYCKNYDLTCQNVGRLKIMNLKKVSDNTIKRVVYEMGVGFYGTHQTSWYFLIIDVNC